MAISKWDLFKKIEEIPTEKYQEIEKILDQYLHAEVLLDDQTKQAFEKSMKEYREGEYVTYDQVFEKSDQDV